MPSIQGLITFHHTKTIGCLSEPSSWDGRLIQIGLLSWPCRENMLRNLNNFKYPTLYLELKFTAI